MKEYESRKLKSGEIFKGFYRHNNEMFIHRVDKNDEIVYVDSNDLLHNLNGMAWFYLGESYYIHGKYYEKQDWEIEVNRIKMLEEI